jgi:hypothetical protein
MIIINKVFNAIASHRQAHANRVATFWKEVFSSTFSGGVHIDELNQQDELEECESRSFPLFV